MPAESQAQAKALNAKFGHAWVKEHHFDNPWKHLPKYKHGAPAPKSRKKGMKRNSKHLHEG